MRAILNNIGVILLNLSLKLLKEEEELVYVYVTLIIHGRRTVETTPETIQSQVVEELLAMELDHLVPDEYKPQA